MEITKQYKPPLLTKDAEVKKDEQVKERSDSLLQQILEQTTQAMTVGTQVEYAQIIHFDDQGQPVIEFQGMHVSATSLIALDNGSLGQPCVITFVNADPRQPLILGMVWNPQAEVQQHKNIEASESLTLTCGSSALEMEANGTVRIKGITVTTQAYGSNRIKGAAVKIN